MQNKEAITKEIISIIKPYCKNQNALQDANPQTHLMDDLRINSARLVDIIIDIESKYDISIDDDTASKVQTIGDVIDIIAKVKQTSD